MRSLVIAAALVLPGAAQAEIACFAYDTGTERAIIALDLPDGDGPVLGAEEGVVEDPEQGYFTSWTSRIAGRLAGDTLEVSVERHIEDSVETGDETWTFDGETLSTERRDYGPIECPDEGSDGGDPG
jgi:hypothetical protein